MLTTHPLLTRLKQQIEELEQQVNRSNLNHNHERYFDPHLFDRPESNDSKIDYLNSIKASYRALADSVIKEDHAKTAFLSEMLINQISALTREVATHHLRIEEPAPIYESISQKHARHLDYLRRLQEMKFELELESDSIDYIKIATIDNRIYRCQQALKKIEAEMEKAEIIA
ncbi:primosomal replication protein [Orbaceae bacterium ESL0721]|nr:primosomal replication protein [Orbaceae bacterium ESL0721]